MITSIQWIVMWVLLSLNFGYLGYYFFDFDRSVSNLFVVFVSLVLLCSLYAYKAGKIKWLNGNLSRILFIILFMLILNSIFQSYIRFPIISLFPTLNRLLLVVFLGYYGFILGRLYGDKVLRLFDRYLFLWVFFLFVISCYQIYASDLIYKNGAHRLSSIYGEYVTGLALMSAVIFIFSFYRFRQGVHYHLITLILSLFLMFGTQSRLSVVSVVISISFANIMSSKKLVHVLQYVLVGAVFMSVLFFIVMNTSIAERLKSTYENGLTDNSIIHRYEAWESSISSMSNSELFTGVGLGGFNLHYYEASGILGMAAHNDYVQLFVETGVIGLLFYMMLQISIIFKLRSIALSSESLRSISALSLAVFTNGFIFASLHNPFYYPESLALSASMVGLCFGISRLRTVN